MNGNYLIDTNILIDFLRGENEELLTKLSKNKCFVSIIAVGELYYGAENSTNPKKHFKLLEAFLSNFIIIDIDNKIAKHYASIKVSLKTKGKPIPENDIWIAGTALSHELTLITYDKHFLNIEQIKTKSKI
jgi:tRNA(fMet)-specific endonuclease VapC